MFSILINTLILIFFSSILNHVPENIELISSKSLWLILPMMHTVLFVIKDPNHFLKNYNLNYSIDLITMKWIIIKSKLMAIPDGSIQQPPASRTIRSPAAKSHMWIPNSKLASAPPKATMHIFNAADPNARTLNHNKLASFRTYQSLIYMYIVLLNYPWTLDVNIFKFSITIFIFSGSLLVPNSTITKAFLSSVKILLINYYLW